MREYKCITQEFKKIQAQERIVVVYKNRMFDKNIDT